MTQNESEDGGRYSDDTGTNVTRPKRLWLRFLVVAATLTISYLTLVVGVGLCKLLDINPQDLRGPRFVVSFVTVSMYLTYQALQALIVFASQRGIHKRSFLDLGFRTPVWRNLAFGFATGVAVAGVMTAVYILAGKNVAIASSVPNETPMITVIGYYCFFFFVWLTANSFGEELVFRCYPIEHFRDNPRMMVLAIVVSASIFTVLHFIIGAFNLSSFLSLLGTAAIFSYVYVYWRSIWLIIGIHNGLSFVGFSVAGNWRMGGLIQLTGDFPGPAFGMAVQVTTLILALWLIHRWRLRKHLGLKSFQTSDAG
jgi:membrane protease YdiL (CAAX protease family)